MVRRIAASLLVLACAHGPGRAPGRAYPPITPPRITSSDDIELAMDEHAAVPIDHPQRATSRAALRGWLLSDLAGQLRRGHPDVAFERFSTALRLYAAEELADAPPDTELLAAAERIRATFSPRGSEREVMTALAVQLVFRPGDREALRRYRELCRWIDEMGAGDPFPTGSIQLIQMHELVLRDLPGAFVRERLEALYLGLQADLGRMLRPGFPPQLKKMIEPQRALAQIGYRLAAAHLRAGPPRAALAAVRRLRGRPGDDPGLRGLLEAVAADDASPADFVSLARYFAQGDAEAAERTCLAGIAALGDHPDLLSCAADLGARRGFIASPLQRARAAMAARPDAPAVREQAARLMLARVNHLLRFNRVDEASREVAQAEKFLGETRRRLPNLDLGVTLGLFRYRLALGCYDVGAVARAERLLEQALQEAPPPEAYVQLGMIRWRRGRFDEALALYDQASRQRVPDVDTQLKLAAQLRRRMGDVLRDKGDRAGAHDAWRDSIRLWDEYVGGRAGEPDSAHLEDIPEAQVERARLLYELGEIPDALRAIEMAIEAAPERGETYVDSVALLATRGHVAEATDALHRALGQPAVNDYYKVYCALWILDLVRRKSGRPDALAQRYLETVDGDQWHHRLARFMAGRISYAELEAQADTPGKKAELFFYEAQNRLAAGRIDEARQLWQRVLRTDMMAFFEYDMALHYLATYRR